MEGYFNEFEPTEFSVEVLKKENQRNYENIDGNFN